MRRQVGGPPTDVVLLEDLGQQRLPARQLAAQLVAAGLRVRLVDLAEGADVGAIAGLLLTTQPRLVVSSILFAGLLPRHLALAAAAKAAGLLSHWTMVGPLPSLVYRELLAAAPALDSVLCGEAEGGIVQLARAVGVGPSALANIPGLAYRRRGRIVRSPLPAAVDLDDLPAPWRGDGLPVFAGYGFATIAASRGCYHACRFCLPCTAYRRFGLPAYRLRSVDSVVEEMAALYAQGARLFLFDDEQFLPPPGVRAARVADLAGALRRRRLRVAFTIKCRPDDVERDLFAWLRELGLLRVYLGVESGCQVTLDRFGKGLRVEDSLRALAILAEVGIVADFRLILWHPWRTLASLAAEVSFLTQALPLLTTCLDFRELEVYPGTPLAQQLPRREDALHGGWLLPYAAADPRVEAVRQLADLVFPRTDSYYARARDAVAAAWFALLLRQRFQRQATTVAPKLALTQVVHRLNRELLAVLQEMICFAENQEGPLVATASQRAATWRARVDLLCATAVAQLHSVVATDAIGRVDNAIDPCRLSCPDSAAGCQL